MTSSTNQLDLKQIIERLSAGIAIVNSAGNFLLVNTTWAEIHGYEAGELLTKHVGVCYVVRSRADGTSNILPEATSAGSAYPHVKHIHRTGKTFHTRMMFFPFRGKDQQIEGYVIMILPLTTDPAQSSLRQLEYFDAIMSAMPDLMFVVNGHGVIIDYRAPDAAAFYASPDDFLGKQIHDVFPADAVKVIKNAQAEAARHGYFSGGEFSLLYPDGLTRWYTLSIATDRESSATDQPYVMLIHEITDRIRAEEAEREQRVFAEVMRDTTAALTATLQLDEVLDRILANVERVVPHDAAVIMLVEDNIARPVRARGHEERGTAYTLNAEFNINELSDYRETVQSGKPFIISDVQEIADWTNKDIWVRSQVKVPILLSGELLGFLNFESAQVDFFTPAHVERLTIFADQVAIAIRNARLYKELVENVEELKTRNAELDAYGYTVAHDLKSPLQVIVGFANLLRTEFQDEVSRDVLDYLGHIESYGVRMSDSVASLLLLARLRDADQQVEPVDVGPVFEQVLDRCKEQIHAAEVTVTIDDSFPAVLGHAPWLEIVFTNLVENALKYLGRNDHPAINIQAERQGDYVQIDIQDNGLGINPEHHAGLFEMGTRYHKRQAPGSGLGLAIVKRVVTRLDGEVGVESELGAGSTFWIKLPAATDL